jgi:hypothetical protein
MSSDHQYVQLASSRARRATKKANATVATCQFMSPPPPLLCPPRPEYRSPKTKRTVTIFPLPVVVGGVQREGVSLKIVGLPAADAVRVFGFFDGGEGKL